MAPSYASPADAAKTPYNIPVLRDPSIATAALPGTPRERFLLARDLGARAVTPDATLPGVRPRDLDRSARRGFCALLRRLELRLEGLDLPIPPEHFDDPARQDRAVAAALAACEFLAETAALVETAPLVFLTLADPAGNPAAVAAGRAAQAFGVTLVTASRPLPDELPDGFAPALDLAREIDSGSDPIERLASVASLAGVRLTDADAAGRRALGDGRLDLRAARAVLETTAPQASLVIDPRGLPDPTAAAASALTAWADAARPSF